MPMIDERVLAGLLIAGGVLVALGWLWLVVRAFRAAILWGLGVLVMPPLAVLFLVRRPDRAASPVGAVLLGLMLACGVLGFNRLNQPSREAVTQTVNGEGVGTLIGATATDAVGYLKANPGLAVVQLAGRADVTDDTLKLLADFPELRELDLNDTPITDAGLEFLATLPKLENLRIARTKVTPDGVARHALGSPRLKAIDVTGLGVPGKALREWKTADPAGRKYVN